MNRILTALVMIAALVPSLFFPPTGAAQAFQPPRLTGRVNDYADILSASTERQLDTELADLERSDSTQLVVLTVPSLQGMPIEEYSIRTVDAWKLGTKENDNGVLLLVAPEERRVRIEVGYGLEGVLTDLRAGRIVDRVILPEFRLKRYDTGVTKGVAAIVSTVRGEYTGTGVPSQDEPSGSDGVSFFPFLVFIFIVSVIGSRRRILGGLTGSVLLPLFLWILFPVPFAFILFMIPGGFIIGLLLSLFRLFPWSGAGRRRHGWFYGSRRSGMWFGGGSRGGFRSGGGFSGGGGGFGGGGASGGW